MLKPKALEASSTVAVLAPSSPVRREFVDRGVTELERLGFRVRLGTHLYARGRYTAGTASERLSDWTSLWNDPEVDAIFCARGGYGVLDLLPHLSLEDVRRRPKVVLGSSDVTALLAFLLAHTGLVTFHGPMVAQQIARGEYDESSLTGFTMGRESPRKLSFEGVQVLHSGSAEGKLVGGCFSLVASLVGTPHLPSFDGAILFLEDTHVKPYQLDRLWTQLRLAGLLSSLAGVVFGQMPGCEQHPDQGYTIEELLHDLTADLGVPVLFGFPSGHTTTPAATLPFGVRARLDAGGLSILESAVS